MDVFKFEELDTFNFQNGGDYLDITKFEEMVQNDFLVTRENLSSKIYIISNIHSKYLKFFYKISEVLIELDTKRDKLYIEKRKYFLNECDDTIKPNHLDFYIHGDSEYSELINKIKREKLKLYVIEEALKRCGTISFFIKNIVDYEKFLVGG